MNQDRPAVDILDCTLRDGSYLIDYQFTVEDSYMVCLGLVKAGFRLIEVGHGTGLRSSEAGQGKAAASDAQYLDAARRAAAGSQARFGMFFIPGIGRLEDLDMARSYGMGFVRIGTNVTEVQEARPFIERAKGHGMRVFSNLMKSYAVSLEEFLDRAVLADRFGADVIVVVDSAGGMFPDDVRRYVRGLRERTDKAIGFHGHNNLQLAMANTLAAIDAGATVVDASLQGMGRSAGNAQTEVLVMVLEKLGYPLGIDPYRTMDLGERLIKPMMSKASGVDDISLVSGIAQFHSSFYQVVAAAAEKHRVDPRMLIVEVSDIDRVHVTPELAEAAARKMAARLAKEPRPKGSLVVDTAVMSKKVADDPVDEARHVVADITSRSKKTGKESVFSITLASGGRTTFPFVRTSAAFVIGNAEVAGLEQAGRIVESLDGQVNWLLLDESSAALRSSGLDQRIRSSGFTWYSERRALGLSVGALLAQARPEGKVLVLSDEEDADGVRRSLRPGGIEVVTGREAEEAGQGLDRLLGEVGAIVSFGDAFAASLTAGHVSALRDGARVLAARPRAFGAEFWGAAIARGLPVCRVDSRVGFAVEIALVIETRKLVAAMGSTALAGVPVVAGGVIGPRGSVVVDSVAHPSCVIGIADGLGGLLPPDEEAPYREARDRVQRQLILDLYRDPYG